MLWYPSIARFPSDNLPYAIIMALVDGCYVPILKVDSREPMKDGIIDGLSCSLRLYGRVDGWSRFKGWIERLPFVLASGRPSTP